MLLPLLTQEARKGEFLHEEGIVQPRVTLWNVEGVVLILLRPSGIVFTNQTGGHACFHPEAEGVLVPFNNEHFLDQPELGVKRQLSNLLTNACHLTPELADKVDDILSGSHETRCAKVDRTRLQDSMEAWAYVDVDDGGECLFSGFGRCKGIITWENSD